MSFNDRYQLTYQDLVDHLMYSYQGSSSDHGLRDCRQAVQNAYLKFSFEKQWKYYQTIFRFFTVAAVDNTLAYTNSTRIATLGTALTSIPQAWAKYGRVKVGNVIYIIESYTDSTHVVLDSVVNPGADIASGTACTLYRSEYPLPNDFRAADLPRSEGGLSLFEYQGAAESLARDRLAANGGTPWRATLIGDRENPGGYVVSLQPYPSTVTSLDLQYQRIPRLMRLAGTETSSTQGTVAISAASAAVVGTGTAFDSSMVGSYLRCHSSTSALPTGLAGAYPYTEQRQITAVADTTHLTVGAVFDIAYASTKYTISDPVDAWVGMHDAILRGCELQLAISRRRDVNDARSNYLMALRQAMANDCLERNTESEMDGRGSFTSYTVTLPDGSVV